MKLFAFGFLTRWAIISIIMTIGDLFDWIYEDWFYNIVCAPIIVPFVVIGTMVMLLFNPWRNVIRPVEEEHLKSVLSEGRTKFIRATKHFWICFELKAPITKKLFFVRTKKEK